jgi:hypothetical protein
MEEKLMSLKETTWNDVDEAMDFAVSEIARLRKENKSLKAALALQPPLLLTNEVKDGHQQVEVNRSKN